MRINPYFYGIFILVVFMGTIAGFQGAGVWSVSGKIDSSGKSIGPDSSGVDSIKGWMKIGDVAQAFDVPFEELLAHFNLPADTSPDAALKDLESETFEVSGLREWLQQRIDRTAPQAAATPLPDPTPTLAAALETPAAAVTEHTPADRTVTGKTTFQELLDWGLTQAKVEEILGAAFPGGSVIVKDYAAGQGLEFSTLKTQFQAELDQVQP